MTMYNYRVESEVSALRVEVVFLGAAIVTALLVNAYILLHIESDLHCLKEMEKEKLKSKIPPGEDEFQTATDQIQEEKPVKEQTQEKETKAESETKLEDEKQ